MNIESNQIRISAKDDKGHLVWLDSRCPYFGMTASVKFYPQFHKCYILKSKSGEHYLTVTDNDQIIEDLQTDGFEILFEMKPKTKDLK